MYFGKFGKIGKINKKKFGNPQMCLCLECPQFIQYQQLCAPANWPIRPSKPKRDNAHGVCWVHSPKRILVSCGTVCYALTRTSLVICVTVNICFNSTDITQFYPVHTAWQMCQNIRIVQSSS